MESERSRTVFNAVAPIAAVVRSERGRGWERGGPGTATLCDVIPMQICLLNFSPVTSRRVALQGTPIFRYSGTLYSVSRTSCTLSEKRASLSSK